MRRSLSVSLLSLALVGALAACSGEDPAAAQAGGPPGGMQLPVEAVTVKAEPLRAGLSTVGTLRADESVVVRPEVNGRLVKIHFEEGQRVKQGDPLFTLDPAVAQAALSEALANLENARRADARASDLGSRQLLSKSDVDTARAQLGVTQAFLAQIGPVVSMMAPKMTARSPAAAARSSCSGLRVLRYMIDAMPETKVESIATTDAGTW